MKLFISILLALVPVLHFTLLYYFAKKNDRLHFVRKNYALWYTDWLYLPFNALYVYTLIINPILLGLSFIFSMTVSIITHHFIRDRAVKQEGKTLFVSKGKYTHEAHVHFIFSVIEMSLVLNALFSVPISIFYTYLFIPILLYFAAWLFLMKRIHGRWDELETSVAVISMILIIAKLSLFV